MNTVTKLTPAQVELAATINRDTVRDVSAAYGELKMILTRIHYEYAAHSRLSKPTLDRIEQVLR
jgi:hypothetical protein